MQSQWEKNLKWAGFATPVTPCWANSFLFFPIFAEFLCSCLSSGRIKQSRPRKGAL